LFLPRSGLVLQRIIDKFDEYLTGM
jgi:hypothetical protein